MHLNVKASVAADQIHDLAAPTDIEGATRQIEAEESAEPRR
jgi:hypothetical protein